MSHILDNALAEVGSFSCEKEKAKDLRLRAVVKEIGILTRRLRKIKHNPRSMRNPDVAASINEERKSIHKKIDDLLLEKDELENEFAGLERGPDGRLVKNI